MAGTATRGALAIPFILTLVGLLLALHAGANPIFQDRFEPLPDDGTRSGSAFKGPFRIGSSVTALTLRPDLTQTGEPFFGDIIANDGQYRIDADIPLGIVELIVSGNFFHEVLNVNTTEPLTLFALSERTGTLNINLLTAIERDRVRALVRAGSTFAEAKAQAIAELFNIFGAFPSVEDTTAISLTGPDAPVLLALTAMLSTQPDGAARSVGDMQQLITQLRTEFESGQFGSARLTELFRSAAAVDAAAIRANLVAYYASVGTSIAIPDFSQSVLDFLAVTGFEVQASSNEGGAISPSGSVWGLPNEELQFQLTPSEGFSLESLGGTCQGTLIGSVFTTEPLTDDCTLSAQFAINLYTVTPGAGLNGSISPTDPQTVEHGQTRDFQLFPDEGYSVAGVTGSCGGEISGTTYTTAPIIADCSFTIEFEINVYAVTAGVTVGQGAITPASQSVEHGSNAVFEVTPDTGWSVAAVTGDTCTPVDQSDGTWVAEAIIEACAVSVEFEINVYTVTVTSRGNGTTEPEGVRDVQFGGVLQILAIPEDGHELTGVVGSCGGELDGPIFSTDPVEQDCTVEFEFEIQTFEISWQFSPGGFVSPSNAIAEFGSSVSFQIVVEANDVYNFVGASGSCEGRIEGANFHVDNIDSDCNFYAAFTFNQRSSLNDTGVTLCTDGLADPPSACPLFGFPGQDGDNGRDWQAQIGGASFVKIGAGVAGFDFTKLDVFGNPLLPDSEEWVCVLDNNTGLIWENKSNDPDSPRYVRHSYTWFVSEVDSNGGLAGVENGGVCVGSSCDTAGYVSFVNEQMLCGRSDWRIPSISELQNIGSFNQSGIAIDRSVFPYHAQLYWSSTPSAGDASLALAQFFQGWPLAGLMSPRSKGTRAAFRPVAGQSSLELSFLDFPQPSCANEFLQPASPSSNFSKTLNAATVRDMEHGLEWQRCLLGQTLVSGVDGEADQCVGDSLRLNWGETLQYIAGLGDGWRMPNLNELRSTIEHCATSPSQNISIFPSAAGVNRIRSSTPYIPICSTCEVFLDFGTSNALEGWGGMSDLPTRLVRDAGIGFYASVIVEGSGGLASESVKWVEASSTVTFELIPDGPEVLVSVDSVCTVDLEETILTVGPLSEDCEISVFFE